MRTKGQPASFDCYAKAKAEDDEPMFILLARDPLTTLTKGEKEAFTEAKSERDALRYAVHTSRPLSQAIRNEFSSD